MADVAPPPINPATTGQLGGQPAPQGGRFAYLLPELSHGGLLKLEPLSFGAVLNTPPPNPIASFLNSGAFSKKQGGKPGLIDMQYEQQVMSKINADGAQYMRFAVADVSPGNFQHGLAPVGGGNIQRG